MIRKHQRYLPVRDPQGNLMPYFVAVANGSCDQDVVRAGNEAVLRARYEDAAFFWRADLQVAPEHLKAGLDRLAFEEHLGSMADRANRIATIVRALALPGTTATPLVALTSQDRDTVARAAGTLASYHPDKLTEPAEVALHDALRKVSAIVEGSATLGEFADAATALTDPINTFFDGVLVMADDPDTRTARLGLLASICELAGTVIDWAALGTAMGR